MNIIEIDELPVNNDWNHFLTILIGVLCSGVTLFNRSIIALASLIMVYVFFPLIYIFVRFLFTDCINKREVIHSKFEMGEIMKYKDSERNCYVEEFVKEMNSRANFWLALSSILIAVLSF